VNSGAGKGGSVRGEFIKFTIVGLYSTGLHYLVLLFVVELLALSPLVGSMVGYCAGAITNYYLNLRYTFQSTAKHRSAVPKFIVMVVCGFVINAGCMYLLTFLPYMISQIIATGCVFFWNFVVGKFWTFASSETAPSDSGKNF